MLAPFSAAWAQPGPPHLGYVFPAGGRRGTTFQVTVGGQYMTQDSLARFSRTGVRAEVLGEIPIPPSSETGPLRNELYELMKGDRNARAEQRIVEIEKQLYHSYVMESRRAIPASNRVPRGRAAFR